MNFYKHHLGDYASSTAHLSIVEHGAYLLMLHHHYATEQPLPLDVGTIARIIRATSKTELDAIKSVLRQFWVQIETGWVQRRAQHEIQSASEVRDLNREKGKLGGRPRKTQPDNRTEPNENPAGFSENTKSGGVLKNSSKISELHDRDSDAGLPVDNNKILNGINNNKNPPGFQRLNRTEPNDNPSQTPDSRHKPPVARVPTTQTGVGPPAECCARLAKAGISNPNPANQKLRAMLDVGYTADELAAIAEEPQAHGKSLAWLLAAAEGRRRDAQNVVRLPPAQAKSPPDTWWASHDGIDRKGREVGMQARNGESYEDFKGRIFDRLRQGQDVSA